jgi:hypothetical protein
MTTKLPVPRLPGRDSHNRAYVQTTSFSSGYWRLRTLTSLVVTDRTVAGEAAYRGNAFDQL